jgi:hypothetical protein
LGPTSRLGCIRGGSGPAVDWGRCSSASAFLYALVSLDGSGERSPYTIGRVLVGGLVLYLVYLFVAFPRDRLGSAADRRFMIAFSAASAMTWALALALAEKLPAGGEFSDCGDRCPRNALALVSTSPSVMHVIAFLVNGMTAAGLLWTAVLLVRKTRYPSRLRRQAVAPVLFAFIVARAFVSRLQRAQPGWCSWS